MGSYPYFFKTPPAQDLAPQFSPEIFCLYCFRSLGTLLSASERAMREAKHTCPEKLLARQPASPPPFN